MTQLTKAFEEARDEVAGTRSESDPRNPPNSWGLWLVAKSLLAVAAEIYELRRVLAAKR